MSARTKSKEPFAIITLSSNLAPSIMQLAGKITGSVPKADGGPISGTGCKTSVSSILDKDGDFECSDKD